MVGMSRLIDARASWEGEVRKCVGWRNSRARPRGRHEGTRTVGSVAVHALGALGALEQRAQVTEGLAAFVDV